MLDIMLNIMDNEQVVQYVRTSVESLLDGKFTIKNFITSKALRDGYKYKDGDIDQNGKEITKIISIIDTFNNIHTDEAKRKYHMLNKHMYSWQQEWLYETQVINHN